MDARNTAAAETHSIAANLGIRAVVVIQDGWLVIRVDDRRPRDIRPLQRALQAAGYRVKKGRYTRTHSHYSNLISGTRYTFAAKLNA